MAQNMNNDNDNMLVQTVTAAIQLPGIKVNRNDFLSRCFDSCDLETIKKIKDYGPIEAGFSQEEIKKIVDKLINKRTLKSSSISFMAGLPGGIAMAATIPADTLQYFGFALRLAQEISYLYGEEDLWSNGVLDDKVITSTLILYCGVMFGASGASATLRIISSRLAMTAARRIPQVALTKTFFYPIIKSIAKTLSTRMTKDIFAKGVSKTIPIVGGVVSGGITFATLIPMAIKLREAFEKSKFNYSEEDFIEDTEIINMEANIAQVKNLDCESTLTNIDENSEELIKVDGDNNISFDTFFNNISTANKLLEDNIITESEFEEIKKKLIDSIDK